MARVVAPSELRAGRLVRSARLSFGALILAAGTAVLPASTAQAASAAAISQPQAGQSINDFYAARGGQPLWLREDGSSGEAANLLLTYLRTADADGLNAANYPLPQLENALRGAWGGSSSKARKADMLLSQAFFAYVRDLKMLPATGMIWTYCLPLSPSPIQPEALNSFSTSSGAVN